MQGVLCPVLIYHKSELALFNSDAIAYIPLFSTAAVALLIFVFLAIIKKILTGLEPTSLSTAT